MTATAWGLAISAAFFFGLALVLTQYGLARLSASLGALVSLPASALLFWCLSPVLLDWSAWQWDAVAIFAAVGLIFPVAATLLTFAGNQHLGPNVTGAMGSLAPLFAVLFAFLVLGEIPTLQQGAGIAAIVTGIVILSTRGGGQGAARSAWWIILLPLLAAAIRGGTQPPIKIGLSLWPSAIAAVMIGSTVSSIVVLCIAALRQPGWTRRMDRSGAIWFAMVGASNGVAILALYAALSRGPVALVSPLAASYPLVTLALSAILLRRTPLTTRLVAGVTVTVGGVATILAA